MSAHEVAIVDSGGANIASLLYALERLQAKAELTTDPEVIKSARRVILPGVGAARDAMVRLEEQDLVGLIRGLSQPVLGICLGMQLLCDASEEENVECLGIIPGTATRLPATTAHPVPNMGWCRVRRHHAHPILTGFEEDPYFYFVHSYALPVSKKTIAVADHAEPFAAIVAHENFVATQFHPERSSAAGARLLANFLRGDA
jgi:glutamine amidotransferase